MVEVHSWKISVVKQFFLHDKRARRQEEVVLLAKLTVWFADAPID